MYEKAPFFKYIGQEYIIERSAARQGRGGMDEGSPETYIVSLSINIDNAPPVTFNAAVDKVIQVSFFQ